MAQQIKVFLFIIMALAVFSSPVRAEETLSAAQKTEIEALVKDYLLNNGDVLMEAVDRFRVKQQEEQRQQAAANIKTNMSYLTSADALSAGNPNGEIVVVEFFDYNCGYCKRALPDIQKLIEGNKDVRVVFKEMPILGPTSRTAAEWAIAAHNQGKYFEYHSELMNHRGPKNEDELAKLAKKIGLDVDQMKKDAKSDAIAAKINKDLEVAREIGVNGTPAFIVDGELFPGYLGEDGLKGAVEAARKKRKG